MSDQDMHEISTEIANRPGNGSNIQDPDHRWIEVQTRAALRKLNYLDQRMTRIDQKIDRLLTLIRPLIVKDDFATAATNPDVCQCRRKPFPHARHPELGCPAYEEGAAGVIVPK